MHVRAFDKGGNGLRWLDPLVVKTIVGDLLEDIASLRAGVAAGADWVFNCARQGGDWGTLAEFRRLNVEGRRLLLVPLTSRSSGLSMGYLGVYEARPFGDDRPFARRGVVRCHAIKTGRGIGPRVSPPAGSATQIIRPDFITGERDRTVLPKLLLNLGALRSVLRRQESADHQQGPLQIPGPSPDYSIEKARRMLGYQPPVL